MIGLIKSAFASTVILAAVLVLHISATPESWTSPAINKTYEAPVSLKNSKVLTWDCEIPTHKPDAITLTCADGGWMVQSINWTQWGKDGAEGTGIFREKLCDPSCAEGDIVQEKVKVELSDLAEREGEFYLRTLDISTASGKDFISGRPNGLEWDVMEFIEVMNWDYR